MLINCSLVFVIVCYTSCFKNLKNSEYINKSRKSKPKPSEVHSQSDALTFELQRLRQQSKVTYCKTFSDFVFLKNTLVLCVCLMLVWLEPLSYKDSDSRAKLLTVKHLVILYSSKILWYCVCVVLACENRCNSISGIQVQPVY